MGDPCEKCASQLDTFIFVPIDGDWFVPNWFGDKDSYSLGEESPALIKKIFKWS